MAYAFLRSQGYLKDYLKNRTHGTDLDIYLDEIMNAFERLQIGGVA
jgi:hypothetical protein